MESLLTPPLAFGVYLALVSLLALLGRHMAAPGTGGSLTSTAYASGEEAPERSGAPGYRPFFLVALFFGILHLGVLVLGTSDLSPIAAVYLLGLALSLLALVIG